MSNQYDGALKEAILAAIKQPDGMKTADIKGYTALQVGRMVQKLQAAHIVFRAPMRGKFGRYFDSLTRAEEFANGPKGAPSAGVVVPKMKGPGHLKGEAIIPSGVKVSKAKPIPDRFAVTEAPSCFASLRPGQYLDQQPKAWVLAVAA